MRELFIGRGGTNRYILQTWTVGLGKWPNCSVIEQPHSFTILYE